MADQEVTFKMEWIESTNILEKDRSLPITQVYGWVLTIDEKIALVSKNGTKWQFPGGHPEEGETLQQALSRELQEEIGLDIINRAVTPQLFGYYVVSQMRGEIVETQYVQTRFLVAINETSTTVNIAPQEKETEAESERIHFAVWKSLSEACESISWLESSDEYKSFKSVTA